MDQTTQGLGLIIAAVIGLLAVLLILRRQRHDVEETTAESPFATSTEGMKRCPHCGIGNLVTDATCSGCGRPLPG